jgi:Ca-activated chloride channel family protein
MHLTGTLTYTTPQGEAVEEPLDAAFGDTEAANSGTHYSQPGVARSVALALLVSGLGEAAQAYGENREAAVALARASRDRYASDVAGMENADMQRELALARRLVELMETGAEQRDPYGGTTHR